MTEIIQGNKKKKGHSLLNACVGKTKLDIINSTGELAFNRKRKTVK